MDAWDCPEVYQRAPAITKAILIEARQTSGSIGCCECPPVLTFRLQIFRSTRSFELSVVSSAWGEVRCGLSPDRPEYFSDDSRRRAGRILPYFLLFLGDGEEKAVERLARDVVLQLCIFFLDQPELRAARGDLVVLLGELHFLHRLLDDRLESFD